MELRKFVKCQLNIGFIEKGYQILTNENVIKLIYTDLSACIK